MATSTPYLGCLVWIMSWSCVTGLGDNKGKIFLIGFPENRILVKNPIIRIYVTSVDTGWVNFTVPLRLREIKHDTRLIRPGLVVIKEYPYDVHMLGTDYSKNSILIQSTVEVTVQGASINNLTTDAFLALPVNALGTDYYVMSYLHFEKSDTHEHGPSEFAIVAIQDNTEVVFHRPPGVRFYTGDELSLNRYDAYQVQSGTSDLTGVRVTSNKPIAVFSGTDWTAVRGKYMGDHLVEQLLPVNTWGSEFLLPPLATRSNGDTLRILAAHDETRVRVATIDKSNHKTFLLNSGEFVTFDVPSTVPTHVISTDAVMVAQFAKSYLADENRLSDPMLSIIPPISQYTTWYTFSTIKTVKTDKQATKVQDLLFDNYIAVIIPSDYESGFRLDGRQIDSRKIVDRWDNYPSVSGMMFTVLTISISHGFHVFGHPDAIPAGAFLYGFKFQEAYGLPLGQKYGTLSHECIPTLMFEGDAFDNDCDGRIDEEILNGLDDDNDNLIDEDLEAPITTQSPYVNSTNGSLTSIVYPFTTVAFGITTYSQDIETVTQSMAEDILHTTDSMDPGTTFWLHSETDGQNIKDTIGVTETVFTNNTLEDNPCAISNDCEIIITESANNSIITIDWNNIKISQGLGVPLGLFWIDIFWLFDENRWHSRQGMSKFLTSLNKTFCLMVDENIICREDQNWNKIANIGNLPTFYSKNNTFYLYSDDVSVAWGDGVLMNETIDPHLSRALAVLKLWKSFDPTERIAFYTDENFWIFGPSISALSTLLVPDTDLIHFWDGKSWEWSHTTWVKTEASGFDLGQKAWAIFSNGVLFSYSGSNWDKIPFHNKLGALSANISSVVLLFDERRWYMNTTTHLTEIGDGDSEWYDYPKSIIRAESPSISINGVLFFLSVRGAWIPYIPQQGTIGSSLLPSLLQSKLGVSWKDTFWVYGERRKDWTQSLEHELYILEYNSGDVPYPGVLFGEKYWIWSSNQWMLRHGYNSTAKKRRKRSIRHDTVIGISWENESWLLSKSEWSSDFSNGNSNYLKAVDITSNILVLSVDNDTWVYNGTFWGFKHTSTGEEIQQTFSNISNNSYEENSWTKYPLGVFYDGYSWFWDNYTLKGYADVDEKLAHIEKENNISVWSMENPVREVVALIKEGKLWFYNNSNWSIPFSFENETINLDSSTVVGVVFNKELWFLHENDQWVSDSGIIVTETGELLDKAGLLVNDTLWVLDAENPSKMLYRYFPLVHLPGLTVIWDENVWTISKNNLWVNLQLEYLNIFPKRAIVIGGYVWSISEFSLNETYLDLAIKMAADVKIENIDITVYFQHMCHQWISPKFEELNDCLTSLEKSAIGSDLAVMIGSNKWFYNGSNWIDFGEAPGTGPLILPWTNITGTGSNETIKYWNGSQWVDFDPSDDLTNLLPVNEPVVIEKDGVFWLWNGTHWSQYKPGDNIDNIPPDLRPILPVVDNRGPSWYWNGTHVILTPAGVSDHSNASEIVINGTIWICINSVCTAEGIEKKSIEDIESAVDRLTLGSNDSTQSFWVWNGTHWLNGNDLEQNETFANNDNIFIYFNGTIYHMKDGILVPVSSNNSGIPSVDEIHAKQPEQGDQEYTSNNIDGAIDKLSSNSSMGDLPFWVWNGTSWINGNNLNGNENFANSDKVFIYVNGTIYQWDGTNWVVASNESNAVPSVDQIPLDDPVDKEYMLDKGNDIINHLDRSFGKSNQTIWVWNGTHWLSVNDLRGNETFASRDNVFVYVNGTIYEWNGTSYVEVLPNNNGTPSIADIPFERPEIILSTEGPQPPKISIIVNGTEWTWDGEKWTSDNVTLEIGESLVPVGAVVSLNGSSWVWDGGTWVKANSSLENSTRLSQIHSPTVGTTGISSTTALVSNGNDNNLQGSYNLTTENSATVSITESYDEEATSSISSTGNDGSVTGDYSYTVVEQIFSTGENFRPEVTNAIPPKSGSSTSGGGKKAISIIVILVIVFFICVFIVIIIIILCWLHKRKRKKDQRQKINPSVATSAQPRPSSQNQLPPISQRSRSSFVHQSLINVTDQAADALNHDVPFPYLPLAYSSDYDISNPSTSSHSSGLSVIRNQDNQSNTKKNSDMANISTSSYSSHLSVKRTQRKRSTARSPKVSQAPPLELPDLIISLPLGSNLHLKSSNQPPGGGNV